VLTATAYSIIIFYSNNTASILSARRSRRAERLT